MTVVTASLCASAERREAEELAGHMEEEEEQLDLLRRRKVQLCVKMGLGATFTPGFKSVVDCLFYLQLWAVVI